MTEFGGSVDELEVDLLLSVAAGLVHKGLAKGDQTALDARDSTLEHDVVLVHLTIVGEATKRGDALTVRSNSVVALLATILPSAARTPLAILYTFLLSSVRW